MARRYLRGSSVAHWVWVTGTIGRAACGRESNTWKGGTPVTRVNATAFPRCRRCVADAGEDW